MLHGGPLATATLETNFGDIQFEFRDDAAPETVQNFLNYINDGDYVNSLFHRLVPGFVLQGGGFTASTDMFSDDISNVDPADFAEVPTDDTIDNEFEVSNRRGTVAMAKLSGDPDSATSQFYVNLVDNVNLDSVNGGFTVFAEVVDMTVVDQIAEMNTVNYSSLFPESSRLRAIVALPYEESGANEIKVARVEQVVLSDGIVHGTVFLDVNGNGTQDAGEGGRGGVVVYDDQNNNGVLDPGEQQATTDELGFYHLKYEAAASYRLRIMDFETYETTGAEMLEGSIDRALNDFGLDFGTRHTGLGFHNNRLDADVDGVNGVTPLDALLVINELDERMYSNPTNGQLITLTEPLNPPRFLDVDDDGLVSPLDALFVINRLTPAEPSAALSSATSRVPASAADDTDGSNDADSLAAPAMTIDQIWAELA